MTTHTSGGSRISQTVGGQKPFSRENCKKMDRDGDAFLALPLDPPCFVESQPNEMDDDKRI